MDRLKVKEGGKQIDKGKKKRNGTVRLKKGLDKELYTNHGVILKTFSFKLCKKFVLFEQ